MDSTRNFQGAKIGANNAGPPQFHNFMYPKQGLFSNIFVNHPFQRTFASVVSCGNNAGINLRNSTSKLMNSFIEAVIKQEQQQQLPAPATREFNDFNNMPNWRSMEHQPKYSKSNSNNNGCFFRGNRYRPPHKKFHYSHHETSPPNHTNNQHHTQFRHYDAKNRHEKERFNIERDIRNDRCDINNRFGFRGRFNQNRNAPKTPANNNNTTTSATTTTTASMKSPPFEIYSLEEFPAIVTTALSQMCSGKPEVPQADKTQKNPNMEQPSLDIDEHDFVKFQSDIALTTPSYVQPTLRFNLCEAVTKIVKSPTKLLSLPLGVPKRSCLKATPMKARNMSECSDDYIVFDYSCSSDPFMTKESADDEEEDDDDDVDDSGESEDDSEEEEEEEESEDECDKTDEDILGVDDYVQQPDSGVEERKVHFNAAVKVNVIRAWDYAYRQARRGDVWQQLARDRVRFSKRIQDCGDVLRPIFSEDHRQRVFKERFETA